MILLKKYTKKLLFFTILIIFLLINTILSFNQQCIFDVNALTSSASSMCVLDESGRILYEKNKDAKRANASTTKIVTAITVLENVENLAEVITVDDKAVGVEGTSIYLRKGEMLKIKDLLYGLMLRSGNDAATALAIHTAQSIENFANLMNETAKKAGATNSHFANPHGLDDVNHYTTAYDLSKIAMYALNNPIFKQIVSTKNYQIPATNESEIRYLTNKNKLLTSMEGCVGVKTGFTSKAGRCLVSAKEIDGRRVVCTVLNCGPMFEESKNFLESSFIDYENLQLLSKEKVINKDNYYLKVDEDFYYPISQDEKTSIKYVYTFFDTTKSYSDGENVGNVEVYLGNNLINSSKLYNISRIDALDDSAENKSIILQWVEGYED